MAIRNSILLASSPLLGALAAVALASGCASDLGKTADDPNTGGAAPGGRSSVGGTAGAPAATGGVGGSSGAAPTVTGGAGVGAGGAAAGGPPIIGGAGVGAGGVSTGGAFTAGGAGSGVGGATAGAAPTAGTDSGVGGMATGTGYNPDFVEFTGKDCAVGTPADINSASLPDLFVSFAGARMTEKSDWSCQRATLKKAVETYIHGEKPGTPDTVTGSVTATSIKVHVEHGGKTIDFSVSVSIPAGATGPVAAIIGLGGVNLGGTILREEGVATISYSNNAIADEKTRNGLFTTIYGSTGASAQVGWAWGVSRIIDVLVSEKAAGRNDIIDPKGIGVTGCSRLGKGAFTIGAFDERIALGIPQESGTGGVSAFRVVNTNPSGPNGKNAQSLESAWSEAQGWFGTVFGPYRSKVNTMPADTHTLVAMYAPRGLLVLDNSRIGELGASAQHAASAAGGEVFKALGVEKNIEYHGGNASDPHNHCSFYESQAEPLRRAIRAHLTKKAPADGRIAPAAVATADLKKWIEWTTPVLE